MIVVFKTKFTEAGNAVSFILDFKGQPADWVAGQYARYELKVDGRLDEHWFTISSAPYEKHLQITTRLTGSHFKKALNTLKPGDEVIVDGIEGDFVWVESELPKLFIAGGIGITPFHSMLKQRAHTGESMATTLLYFNNQEIPFKAEFDRWALEHPEFQVVYLKGAITGEVIKEHAPQVEKSLIYISGAEGMVETVGSELKQKYGLAAEQLMQDWFPGYHVETS